MPSTTKTSATPRVTFASLTPNNLGTVRKLNAVLFPIKYSEKFYQDILLPEAEDFCKLVYYNDVPVGTICCRMETKHDVADLYLMTMGVLAPYRSRGVGAQALQVVLDAAQSHEKPAIRHIYLHVQVSNGDAKRFYARHGFEELRVHADYYRKLQPRDAWVLQKTVGKA